MDVSAALKKASMRLVDPVGDGACAEATIDEIHGCRSPLAACFCGGGQLAQHVAISVRQKLDIAQLDTDRDDAVASDGRPCRAPKQTVDPEEYKGVLARGIADGTGEAGRMFAADMQ